MPTASAGISNGIEPFSRQCNEDDSEAKRAEKAKFRSFSLFCPLRPICLSDSYTGTAPRAPAGGRARDQPPADARGAVKSLPGARDAVQSEGAGRGIGAAVTGLEAERGRATVGQAAIRTGVVNPHRLACLIQHAIPQVGDLLIARERPG